jgi:hypothetical protein
MVAGVRPAAYVRVVQGRSAHLARQHHAVREGARQRGWPEPEIYAEYLADGAQGGGRALARLQAAVMRGCHNGLLIADPAAFMNPGAELLGLLFVCTRQGVEVGLLLPSAIAEGLPSASSAASGVTLRLAAKRAPGTRRGRTG